MGYFRGIIDIYQWNRGGSITQRYMLILSSNKQPWRRLRRLNYKVKKN
jgi:hypothetical protein